MLPHPTHTDEEVVGWLEPVSSVRSAGVRPNWSSDDSGSLCINGVYYDGEPGNGPNEGQWKTTRPIELKRGDVVLVAVHVAGALEIHVNGIHQVTWHAAQVPTTSPLYALVSMRAPARAVALRQRDPELSQLPGGARTLTLKGIEGRAGEMIDLSKHARPKYPATFANVRAVSDIRSLYPLLQAPGDGRVHGRKEAQPILLRAGPGTGKTWCIMQLLFFLARGQRSSSQQWAALRQGLTRRCKYLAGGHAENAARLELTPYVVYVQKLARLMRQSAQPMPTGELVLFYMRAEREERTLDDATLYASNAVRTHAIAMPIGCTFTPHPS